MSWRRAQSSCWLLQILTPKVAKALNLEDLVDQLNPKEQGVLEAVNLVSGFLDRCHSFSAHCKASSINRATENLLQLRLASLGVDTETSLL